jgi:hypothetical protein
VPVREKLIRSWTYKRMERVVFFFFSSKVPPRKSIFGASPALCFDGGALNFFAEGDGRPLPKIAPVQQVSKATRKAETDP